MGCALSSAQLDLKKASDKAKHSAISDALWTCSASWSFLCKITLCSVVGTKLRQPDQELTSTASVSAPVTYVSLVAQPFQGKNITVLCTFPSDCYARRHAVVSVLLNLQHVGSRSDWLWEDWHVHGFRTDRNSSLLNTRVWDCTTIQELLHHRACLIPRGLLS